MRSAAETGATEEETKGEDTTAAERDDYNKATVFSLAARFTQAI